ncbi:MULTISPECIES: bacteriophage holin [Parachlamydia]|uniref:Major facilitator superfamily (MFS) profile domain-containing protein n=2 Tax=Parachlamydia acanthamoebae TaxID=83552 RepID=F8KXH3_PARAV|nr:bacteriophage holin [Parachlamydia acanthamoebae]EFB40671.1 hypothetical protein pah_c197o057 [Parachlamydia acanthamoebae str. Hall's coccus]KIA77242.1 hypothetical protein DB43_GR00090 [Parachlamydia acanthamoebae]CCB87051.1 putative uncharacterized protein [Parachlamydia acanthamoebae UV-7]
MLNPTKLGLAGGILWGLSMFVCTLLAHYFGYGTHWLSLVSDVYPGYSVSLLGSIIGLIYGFIDGFVGLFLLGWLYNKLL